MALRLSTALCGLFVFGAASNFEEAGTCTAEDCGVSAPTLLQMATKRSFVHLWTQAQQSEQPRTIKIMEYSAQYWEPREFYEMAGCGLPCTQASSLEEADVVYAAAATSRVARAHPKQVWVAEFWESPQHYPALSKDYDYSYSYRADATFPDFGYIPHVVADMFDDERKHLRSDSAKWPRRVSFAEKSKRKQMISVWISNCGVDTTGRLSIVQDLGKHGVPYASYGNCLHNAESLTQLAPGGLSLLELSAPEMSARERELLETSAEHLFFLAAENSACAYYHTEKVYHGLLAGSIPVYVGSSVTIDDSVPRGSTIKASDFASTMELAEYLKRVASNESLYNSFFDWYHQDLSQTSAAFRARLLARHPDRCAECAFHHNHGRNKAPDSKALGCSF